MAWPIQDMPRSTGTTSRTLRHDGELGLLAPVAPQPTVTATHENARKVTNTAAESGSHPGLGERGRVASAGAGTQPRSRCDGRSAGPGTSLPTQGAL